MDKLITLYKTWSGSAPLRVDTLPKAGSNRQYVRIEGQDGQTVIGVIGPSIDENRCFVYLARHFASRRLSAPRIHAVSDDGTRYLQQDLGTRSLYDALAGARQGGYVYGEEERRLLERTVRLLAHIQVEGAEGLDFGKCLQPKKFTAQAATFDLHYFKYSFLKTTDLPFDEIALENDFRLLADHLVQARHGDGFFLYRDFQARNIMLPGGSPHFIDFQGGMQGPLEYDVASFLWQASARYPQALRDSLTEAYTDEAAKLIPGFSTEEFRSRLRLFVLFRILQVLGAYGLRGYYERKKYFLDSIPLAIGNLRASLDLGTARPYPYLERTLRALVELPRFRTTERPAPAAPAASSGAKPALRVRVFSFSYKKGIPEDTTGNGGGYVFDCRGTHNPGRYEQYKHLTGLDAPVARFLEEDGEILVFLDAVCKLADRHVERYMERGFTDLMFSFGCTGGQHRSVYCARRLAEHIHRKYGIEVRLCHREQGMAQTFA